MMNSRMQPEPAQDRSAPVRDLIPTSMQVAMAFASIRDPAAGNYVQQLRIRLREDSDPEHWERAFNQVLKRHEMLRGRFDLLAEEGPRIEILEKCRIPIRVFDLTDRADEIRDHVVRQHLEEDCRRGFQTDDVPMMRLAFFRHGEDNHELIWTSHHALFDGRGRYIVLREVTELVDARMDGRKPILESPIPYGPFLEWMANRPVEADESFWRSQLSGLNELPSIAFTESGAAAVGGDERQALRQSLGSNLGGNLEEFAKSAGVTVNTLVQGAWALVLARQSGQEEVVFGAPRACRHGSVPGAGKMVGVMVNTVPMRIKVDSGMKVGSFLKELRDLWVEMRPFEHAPLTLMRRVADLSPEQPLFESLVGFEGYELTDRLRQDDHRWENREATLEARTELPLTLQLYRSPEWDFVLTFDPSLFPVAHAEWMADRFRTALESLVGNPNSTLGQISILSERERESLSSWGIRKSEFPDHETVHARFAEVARQRSRQEALIWEDEVWTYGELDRRANALGHHLAREIDVDGELVAVVGPRSTEQILAILAILKAGGAYLPLDPGFPDERLRLLIEESGAAGVVACGGWSALNRNLDVPCIRASEGNSADSDDPPPSSAGPESPAYVMFTSGSTGRPKGVEVPHRAIMRLLFGTDYVELGPEHTLIHLSPAAFDASTFEIWGSLLHGSRCILYPERVPTPDRLGEILRRYRVDTVFLTSSLFNFIVDEAIEILRPVRQLLTGGEVLSRNHVVRALELLPETHLISCYGPTETTTFATTHNLPRTYRAEHGPVPIGRPISNTSVVIVDQEDRLAPIGCEGELLIGGPGVALGYRRRPELTAEKFVEVSDLGEDRFYRSGDRVYWRADGTIAFVGRVDDQVKIRGYRIELGEVESELRKIDGVRRAAVVLVDEAPRGKALLAAVVIEPEYEGDVDVIRRHMTDNVPDFMVPGVIRAVDELPLNPNGKVDRKQLEALLKGSMPEVRPIDSGPGVDDPDRAVILEILSEVLGLDFVDESRSFFDLGGDSLAATRFAARVSRQLAKSIPISGLFGASSIREALEQVTDRIATDSQIQDRLPTGIDRKQLFPLTPKIESLLQFRRRNPGIPIGVIGRAFRIRGSIDRDAFTKAVDWLIDRHEALRTFLVTLADGEVRQTLEQKSPSSVEFESRPEGTSIDDQTVIKTLDQQVSRGLDPFVGPVTRFRIISSGDAESVLLITTLHIATDGASLPVLLGDLFGAYEAFSIDQTPERVPLNLQYLDFQDWYRRLLKSSRGDELRRAWRERMSAPTIMHFRSRCSDKPGDYCQGRMRYLALDRELGRAIRKYSQDHGISNFVTGMIGFKALISYYTGASDIMIATSVNLKESTLFDGAIGDYSNVIAVRSDLSGALDLDSVSKRVISSFSEAFQDRHLPKSEIRAMVPRPDSILDDPYCPFCFTEIPAQEFEIPKGLEVSPINRKERQFFFIFQANIWEEGDTFRFRFSYAKEVFDEVLVESFISDYIEVLRCLTSDPRTRLDEIPWREKTPGLLAEVEESESAKSQLGFLRLVREVLRIDSVDIAKSFMELGGDSLLAMRLVARASGELGAEIRPSDILGRASIEEIIASLDGRDDRASIGSGLELESVDRFSLWPLGPKQEHYVESIKAHPGQPVSVLGRAFQISGELNQDALQKAVDWVVDRHESLRTVLVSTDGGQVAQKVIPHLPVTVEWVPFEASESKDGAFLEALSRFVHQGIDSFSGPLLHLRVLESGPSDHCLLLKVLHTAIDGALLPVLFGDLADAYNLFLRGESPILPTPTLQFLDFQVWRDRVLKSDRNGQSERFWKKQMQDVPAIGFPGFPSIDGFRSCQARIRYFDFPVDLADEVRASARKIGVTPFTVGLAAYAGLLKLYSGQNDFTIGTSLNLREDPRFDGAIGDFSNPIQLRIRLSGDQHLEDVLGLAVRSLAQVMDHRLYPAVNIRKMVPKGRSNFEDPINNFVFSEMRDLCERFDLSRCSVRQIEPQTRLLIALMSTNFMDTGKAMRIRTSYATEVFTEETIERFFSDYFRLAGEIIRCPGDRLMSFKPSWPMAGCFAGTLAALGKSGSTIALTAKGPTDTDPSLVSQLTSSMSAVLGREIESPKLSFFELGGDSIGMLRFLSRLRSQLGVNVDYLDFTRNPSVSQLAQWISYHHAALSTTVAEPIVTRRNRGPTVLTREVTERQIAGWKKVNWQTGGIGRAFRVSGDLDLSAYERALRYVIGRHEILGMEVRMGPDGRLSHVFPKRVALKLEETDRSDSPIEAVDEMVESIYRDECQAPLGPMEGPLYRFRVVHLPAKEKLLLITVSHGITDGIGLVVLLREIGHAYEAYSTGRIPRLKRQRIQARDYLEWLEEWRKQNRARLESFWSGIFADGIPEQQLPFDQPGDPDGRYLGRYIYLDLAPELMKAVHRFADQLGTTEYIVLLTAYLILVNRTTGTEEPVVSFVSNGRIHPDAEEIIGNFTDATVIRGRIRSTDRLANLVCDVARTTSDSLAHAGIPVQGLIADQLPRVSSRDPRLSSFFFNQVPDTYRALTLGEIVVRPLRREVYWRSNSISFLVFPGSDGSTTAQFCYPTELMSAAAAQSFLNGFREIVRSVVEAPEALVSDLPDFGGGAKVDTREDELVLMFSAVLGTGLGRNESFFDLGGDSLAALRLLVRIRHEYGVGIEFAQFTLQPTVEGVAQLIVSRSPQRPVSDPIVILDSRGPFDISRSEVRKMKAALKKTRGRRAGIARAFRVSGPFDSDGFERALRLVVGRHESLRMRIDFLPDGGARRTYPTEVEVHLLREDQADVDSTLVDSRIESICREESLTPLPAPEGESYRFRAIRFPNSETLLLLTISHDVADGLGFARFIDEVGCAYRAWVAGLEPELPDVTVQALDFSGWLDSWRDDNRERLTAYWRKQFPQGLPRQKLPLAEGTESGAPYLGKLKYVDLSINLMNSVRAFSEQLGTTPLLVLLSAYLVLLNRTVGTKEPCAILVSDGRIHPDAEQVIGNFTNPVPVQARLSDDMSLANAVLDIVAQASNALGHAGIPVGTLVEQSNHGDGQGGHPVNEIFFNQMPAHRQTLDLGSLKVRSLWRTHMWRSRSMHILVSDNEDGSATCQFAYPSELMPEDDARSFLIHFRWITEAIVAEPESRLGALLGPMERALSSECELALERSFSDILGCKVRRNESFFDHGGDSLTALRLLQRIRSFSDISLTYEDLIRCPTPCDLAALVSVENVDTEPGYQGDLLSGVARLSDRGPVRLPEQAAAGWRQRNLGKNRFPYSITRAFRLDGSFDPGVFYRALSHVIGRHEALRTLHRCLDNGGVEQVILDQFDLDVRCVDLSDENPEAALERAREIYDQESVEPLELTKGLPGRFCVIQISDTIHLVALTFYHGLVDGIGLSIVFDELSAAYAALASGRTPRLSPVKVQALDYSRWLKSWVEANNARLEAFWKNVYREGIPHVQPHLENEQRPEGAAPGSMQRIILPANLMDRVEKRARYYGVTRFHFLYAGVFVMFARDPDADVTMISTITNARRHPDAETVVGQFIQGIPVIISPLRGMQVGVAIEHIGARAGDAMAHSFPGAVGLGRQILEEQGREDEPFGQVFFNQVPDIESAFHLEGLACEPWSRKNILIGGNLAITARTRQDGSTVIQLNCPVALLSKQGGVRVLKRYRDTITWMLDHPQGVIEETDNLSGERPVLMEKEQGVIGDRPDLIRAIEGVTGIFEKLLGRPVGCDAAFFAAGGDSLMAASLLHRVNREFRVNLSFATFEKDSTARQLAEAVESAARSTLATGATRSARTFRDGTDESVHPPLVPLPRPIPRKLIPEPLPGVPRQDYGAQAIICRGFDVGKGFDLETFERAFRLVVARHEALRRCYRRDGQGQVWCVVRDDPKLKFEVIDLGNLSGREADLRISEVYASESRRRLEPFSGGMHRAKILHVGTDRTVVIFSFTHRFVDGVSVVSILSETGQAYQALAGGREPSLPPVLIQESDYQAWLDQWEENNQERLEGFWRRVFRDGFPPRPFKRPEIRTGRRRVYGRFLNFSIPAREMHEIRAFASARGTTPHYVFLSAYFVFFNRWLGLNDIMASSVRDLRMLPEARDVVGCFISNTPVRVGISEVDTLEQVAERVTRIGRDAMAHSAPRLRKIIVKLLDEAGNPESPLGSILLNQVTDTYGALELGDIPVRPLLREVAGGRNIFSNHRYQRDGSAGFQVGYPVHLISAEEFEPLLKDYRTILRAIISSPETRVGDLQNIGQDTKLG